MSVFLSNAQYFFLATDGSMQWPNSADGDLLKQAYAELTQAAEWEQQATDLLQYLAGYLTGSGHPAMRVLAHDMILSFLQQGGKSQACPPR